MFIPCPEAVATFPVAGLTLTLSEPGQVLLDCHHGDIFVLRATGLTSDGIPTGEAPGAIRLALTLSPPQTILARCEEFAAHQQLNLSATQGAAETVEEQPVLTAGHIPGQNLFIYSETASLSASALPLDRVEIRVTGNFKTRKIPCREADLVIHLERAAAARLVNFLAHLLRARL
jgi:hypothetical protein